MSYHSGSVFSARDRDPNNLLISCAVSYRGAWWYRNCHYANLNGLYGSTVDHQVRGRGSKAGVSLCGLTGWQLSPVRWNSHTTSQILPSRFIQWKGPIWSPAPVLCSRVIRRAGRGGQPIPGVGGAQAAGVSGLDL